MSQEWLHVAGDMAERAADEAADQAAADEQVERLRDLAEQLHALADRDRGPDHGRIARIENIIAEIREEVGEAAAEELDRCHDEVVRYRETVEGV